MRIDNGNVVLDKAANSAEVMVVANGANLEIGTNFGGKSPHLGNIFSDGDSIVLNGGNHSITVNNASSIGSITNTPTSVPELTLTIIPGHTVNLGRVGAPTDLSNGAVAFVRIDQPTLVTDGCGTSFVVTPNDVPASITVSALRDVVNSLPIVTTGVAYTAGVVANSNNTYNPFLGLDGDYENFMTAVMGNNAPNDSDSNGG
jgi:hypothetical protein